jgi:amino acid transporter
MKNALVGAPLNPMNIKTRHRLTLIALLAWIGLGADALSSSCYGPEEAYLALGVNNHLALFIAAITVITVFIISLGYNQVIELFPGGGGGYKVASQLLHPYAGLVAGAALIVDYVLTIAISVASGADAIFSFLPLWMIAYKLYFAGGFIIILLILNLRGMKEAIYIMAPIFLGFIVSHVALIIYGIVAHSDGLSQVVPDTINETHLLAQSVGWFGVIGVMLHAYSVGSGTYTGIEAVSNNVQNLAEPRAQTGKRTMLYMAISLSFMAGGLILLYLLWHAQPVPGKTLNAVVFQNILGESWAGHTILILMLQLEAGLLFVAANAGFVAGPGVLANMAADNWLPKRFQYLSKRLVVQNGLMLFGLAALIVLFWTGGKVSLLVVLYSINVFITFTLSLLGVAVYWIRHRASPNWYWHFAFSMLACVITAGILCITLYYKFAAGGWTTLVITGLIVTVCVMISRHYKYVKIKLNALDVELKQPIPDDPLVPHALDPQLPTAILFVNSLSVGMHTLLSVIRLFPGQFKNFVFLSVGEVDTESYRGEIELAKMQAKVNGMLDYFVKYCQQYQIPAESFSAFGTDLVLELERLADTAAIRYPRGMYFTSRLVFANENIVKWYLHNQTPLLLQHYLHFRGKELMILPMKI